MSTSVKRRRRSATPAERKTRVDALNEKLNSAIAKLINDDQWADYLRAAATFGTTWSFNNLLLILAQAQDRGLHPTMLKTFDGWKKLGRTVSKGQTALYIFEPVRYRLTLDEAHEIGANGFASDGRPIVVVRRFRPSPRFDVSQTEGEPLPPNPAVPKLLAGEDATGAWEAIASQITTAGYRITRGDCRGANGFTDPLGNEVRVRDDVDQAQAVKTLLHELAHIQLEHVTDYAEYRQHHGRMEAEAESVAYIVTGTLGLDSASYSVPYIARWCDGDLDILAELAQRVTDTAQAILSAIDGERCPVPEFAVSEDRS